MLFNSKNSPKSIMRRSIMLFFIIFLVTGGLISGGMMVFYRSEIKTLLNKLIVQETYAVELQSQSIGDILDSIFSDLLFISQQNELMEYLANKNQVSLDKIALEYVVISKLKMIYDQIRFIDSDGLEIVRVNYNQGSPVIVSKDRLQSKRSRYYFQDAYTLEKDAVFISPFDLNIEKGIIEYPLKPMIRMATPVFNSANQKQGIVIVNYLGNTLLDKILESESVSVGQTMLLNSDGYWLLSPDPDQAWGFMSEDKQRTFYKLYPEVWREIILRKNGQINTAEGLFTYKTIYPVKKNYISVTGYGKTSSQSKTKGLSDLYQWHLISFVPSDMLNSYSSHLQMKLFGFGVAVFLLIATGSWMIALAITRRQIHQAQLKVMALYDPLTELPNRRLFFDRLTMTLEISRRNNKMFCLLYIDLDGFKNVNDTLGHESGDKLLCMVAELLLKACRKSDTIARLGGDEFAVIISEIESEKAAEVVAEKIIATFSEPIQLISDTVQVGVSIGIALFPGDSENAEELVRLADDSMYISKKQGKNTYTFSCPDSNQ